MTGRALQICLIVLMATIQAGQTEIALPKCCLQNEIMSQDIYCVEHNAVPEHSANYSDNFKIFAISNFNYQLENHYERFRCKYSSQVQIEFCMNTTEFSTNFNLSALRVRKGYTVFGLDDNNYCVDYVTNGHIIVKMCQAENICDKIPCVNRCCLPGHVWWNDVDNCKNVTIKNSASHLIDDSLDTDPVRGVRIKNLTCKTKPTYTKTGYYFDDDLIQQQDELKGFEYCNNLLQMFASQFMYDKLCAPVGGTLEKVKLIGTLISFFGILGAIIFYVVVPELLDLHGKLVLSLLITMLLAYITLAFGHNLFFIMEIGIKCKILGYFIYFTALTMFAWSNALCYNIYRLSAIRNRNNTRLEERSWYLRYLVFAICYPLFMLFILIILDNMRYVPKYLKPGIGSKVCFFADTTKRFSSYLILFFIPSGIQIILNWVFFALLVKKIIKTIRMLNIGRRVLPFSNASKLFTMAKLSLVMGLPWTLELALFFWQNETLKIIADLFNTASGLIFFLVFVLTKSTFTKCRKRYDVKTRVKGAFKVMDGTPHTSLTSLLAENGSNRNTRIVQ